MLSGAALVAQWIEHLTTDQKVGGSSPSKRTRAVQVRGTLRGASPRWGDLPGDLRLRSRVSATRRADIRRVRGDAFHRRGEAGRSVSGMLPGGGSCDRPRTTHRLRVDRRLAYPADQVDGAFASIFDQAHPGSLLHLPGYHARPTCVSLPTVIRILVATPQRFMDRGEASHDASDWHKHRRRRARA
jgi:hypothetical protein